MTASSIQLKLKKASEWEPQWAISHKPALRGSDSPNVITAFSCGVVGCGNGSETLSKRFSPLHITASRSRVPLGEQSGSSLGTAALPLYQDSSKMLSYLIRSSRRVFVSVVGLT